MRGCNPLQKWRLGTSLKRETKSSNTALGWWYTREIPALGRLGQENHKFEAKYGYTVNPASKVHI